MSKKQKRECVEALGCPDHLEYKKQIVLKDGKAFEIMREDGAFYYCTDFKIRKTNPSIKCIEPVVAHKESVPFEEEDIVDGVMDNGNDE